MAATLATFQGYISNGTSGIAGTILNITTMTTGTIQLGMAVYGGATLSNTHIVAFLTGTGGTGTYKVGVSQTIGQAGTPASFNATTAAVVTAADYNYIRGITSVVLGPPTTGLPTPLGYNMPILATADLASGPTAITALQWSNLRTDLLSAYLHQGIPGNLPYPSIPTKANASNPAAIVNAIDFSRYLAIANTVFANALAIGSGQSSLVTVSAPNRTTPWNTIVTHTITLTWPSSNAAKAFFNSGGNFQFFGSLNGYLVTDPGYAKSDDWHTLLLNLKTVVMNYNSTTCTGSYTTIASNNGFYNLTTSDSTLINKTTSSPSYTPNQYNLLARVNAGGNVLIFTIKFQDDSVASGHNPLYAIDENVTGTLNSTVQAFYASGTNVSATYPTVSVSGP
jgi:hypothetical protein